jgi:hypothetical protein
MNFLEHLLQEEQKWWAAEVVYYFDFRSPIIKPAGARPLPARATYSAYHIEMNGVVIKDKPPSREVNTTKALEASIEVGELKRMFKLEGK